jgi:hypothetical protein
MRSAAAAGDRQRPVTGGAGDRGAAAAGIPLFSRARPGGSAELLCLRAAGVRMLLFTAAWVVGSLHQAGYTLLASATWQSSGILPSPVAAAIRTPAQASARP